MTNAAKSTERKKIPRNAAATRQRILESALTEFGSRGYGGGRIAEIAKGANCNIRMVYHYFGSKHDLYIACLERVYSDIRSEEQTLNLLELPPLKAIEKLVEFTFDHMQKNPDFVRLAGVENTEQGKYIKKIPDVANAAAQLISNIEKILRRGVRSGTIKKGIDPFQLYISILSLSYLHLSNRYTLSITYGRSLTDTQWLKKRRTHVCQMILGFVKSDMTSP